VIAVLLPVNQKIITLSAHCLKMVFIVP